jgi:hypothetical protein
MRSPEKAIKDKKLSVHANKQTIHARKPTWIVEAGKHNKTQKRSDNNDDVVPDVGRSPKQPRLDTTAIDKVNLFVKLSSNNQNKPDKLDVLGLVDSFLASKCNVSEPRK